MPFWGSFTSGFGLGRGRGQPLGGLRYTLVNPNEFGTGANDIFGSAVGISESYTIVGAHQEDITGQTNDGKAYIFSSSSGAFLRTLDNPNDDTGVNTNGDRFGFSVDICESFAIVGAPFETKAGSADSGLAYVFDPATGNLIYTLDNPDPDASAANDQFGISVAITDSYAIVGAHQQDDASGTNGGKAYIFSMADGSLLYTLDNPNPTAGGDDFFGRSVDICESYSIVGSYGENLSSGRAYIYDNSDGSLLYNLNNPTAGTSQNDFFGWSVSISESFALVGAYGTESGASSNSGAAYLYNTSDGSLRHTLTNPNPTGTAVLDVFGYAVSVNETYSMVGAQFEDESGSNNSGRAYIYSNATGSLEYTFNNPNTFGTPDNDNFGEFVAISKYGAVIGAKNEDETAVSSSGAAYGFFLKYRPTYSITPSYASVNEGDSITFTVTTTNIDNGTVLYWSLSSASDFSSSTGSVTINNNTGSFSVTPSADSATEGPETFFASLRTGSTTGAVQATSQIVTINDTSVAIAAGQEEFTTVGTFSWTAPAGVTSVSVVCIGGGGGGGFSGQDGAGGGGLGWKNNITVVPGNSYTVVVGDGPAGGFSANATSGGDSYFIDLATVAGLGNTGRLGGGHVGDGGGDGGDGAVGVTGQASGGGGAGGYSGNGGDGGAPSTNGAAGSGGGAGGGAGGSNTVGGGGGGGGVGIYGEGASGTGGIFGNPGHRTNRAGFPGSGGTRPTSTYGGGQEGGLFGGGAGSGQTGAGGFGGVGGQGAVRIIWGAGRAFPSTNTADV